MRVFQLEVNGELRIGLQVDRGMVDFTRAYQAYLFHRKARVAGWYARLQELIEAQLFGEELFLKVLDFLETHNFWDEFLLNTTFRLRAPVLRPGKIIAIGLNYAAHAAEGGWTPPSEPMYFGKVGSIVIGPDDAIQLPAGVGRVDHELELAVVIGRRTAGIREENYQEYVAGYTIFNDVTARDVQRRAKEAGQPWFASKNMDSFAPMGPCLVTPEEIPDPHNLNMELRVNGVVKQKASTSDMLFKIPRLLIHISQYLTMDPGDVLATGTPEGISPLQDGNVVEAEIEKIGILRNTVVQKTD
jgi:2-keto-4-pentenoate hydratase/2-oxohepta-3-ene-1,7-dioic acid hydratase in catechol pathway